MKTLKVYYDYLCPYCYKGVMDLLDLLPVFPEIEVEWIPCEAHPRPEERDQYTDIANMAFYSVKDQGGDIKLFNKLLYLAIFQEKKRSDDLQLLSQIAAKCGADGEAVCRDVTEHKYDQVVYDNNMLTWVTEGFEAVPDYQMDMDVLASAGGQMIAQEELMHFLEEL